MTPGENLLAPAQASRRTLLIGLGFAAAAGLAAAATPRRHEDVLGRARLDRTLPDRVGAWRFTPGGSVVLPDAQGPTSVYDQVAARSYVSEGKPLVMLLIAYGAAQSGLMQVHRPETCYSSSGFAIRQDKRVALSLASNVSVAARSFSAEREDRSEEVLYWTRVSSDFPDSPLSQRLIMLKRGLQGVVPDGVLVRISTFGGDVGGSGPAMVEFAKALVGEAGAVERALLIGPISGSGRA